MLRCFRQVKPACITLGCGGDRALLSKVWPIEQPSPRSFCISFRGLAGVSCLRAVDVKRPTTLLNLLEASNASGPFASRSLFFCVLPGIAFQNRAIIPSPHCWLFFLSLYLLNLLSAADFVLDVRLDPSRIDIHCTPCCASIRLLHEASLHFIHAVRSQVSGLSQSRSVASKYTTRYQ